MEDRCSARRSHIAAAKTTPRGQGIKHMKMQLLEKMGVVLVLGLGAMLITPLRYALVGVVKHERFYQRRPTSYWLKILKDEDARYRQWAAAALGDLGPEPGVVG